MACYNPVQTHYGFNGDETGCHTVDEMVIYNTKKGWLDVNNFYRMNNDGTIYMTPTGGPHYGGTCGDHAAGVTSGWYFHWRERSTGSIDTSRIWASVTSSHPYDWSDEHLTHIYAYKLSTVYPTGKPIQILPCVPWYFTEYVDLKIDIVNNSNDDRATIIYITGTDGVPDQQYIVSSYANSTYQYEYRVYFDDPDAWRDAVITTNIPAMNYTEDIEISVCSECVNAYCLEMDLIDKYIVNDVPVLYPNSIWRISAKLIFNDWEKCNIDKERVLYISYAGTTLVKGSEFDGPTEIIFPAGELTTEFEIEIYDITFSAEKMLMINATSTEIGECDDNPLLGGIRVFPKQPYSTCCDFVPKDFVAWSDYHNYEKFYGLEPFITKSKI